MTACDDSPPLSAATRVALLLLSAWPTADGAAADRLTPRQLAGIERSLARAGRSLASLAPSDYAAVLAPLANALPVPRLCALLGREAQLSAALAGWTQAGIWVVGRWDSAYPARWRHRLGLAAPPLLFGCGQPALLGGRGLAVVGSRDATAEPLAWAADVGALCAQAGATVVSGAARGVDQAAMSGALAAGGRAVAVVAQPLARVAAPPAFAAALVQQRLTLVTPHDPAQPFHAGVARARNRLIYTLAGTALVVETAFNRGGTWGGAVEQLRHRGGPRLYARDGGSDGLQALLRAGACPWPNPHTAAELRELLRADADEGWAAQPGLPLD